MYRTVDHDSLKISNGKWFWWSQGFGGYSALDYLIKVRNYSFMEAVEILTGKELSDWTPPPPKACLLYTSQGRRSFCSATSPRRKATGLSMFMTIYGRSSYSEVSPPSRYGLSTKRLPTPRKRSCSQRYEAARCASS